jgi:hypothetical protein
LVTLPEIGDAAVWVRCPLCRAEYALSEALASTPPMLVVVPKDKTASKEESPAGFAMDFAKDMTESPSTEVDDLAGMEAFALNTGDPSSRDEKAAKNNEPVKTSAPAGPMPAPPRPLVKPLPPRPKRKPKGAIRTLTEWLFGAAFALCIAYYGIWWIRGESAGLPRFDWLPGLPAPEPKTDPILPSRLNPESAKPKASSETKEHVENPPQSVDGKVVAETPMPKIGPLSVQKFGFMQLDEAIDIASSDFFVKSGGKVTSENYPLLCRLAEVRTFVILAEFSPKQSENIRLFLSNLGKDPKQREEIARLGREMLKANIADNESEYRGILLVGKAGKTNSSNGLFGVTLLLTEKESIPVLSTEAMSFKAGDELLVAGSLIPKPSKNIIGFKGTSPMAVWLGDSVTLAAPAVEEKKDASDSAEETPAP